MLKMCRVWLEDSGCSNKPSEAQCSISHHRRGELVFCVSGLSGPRQGGGFLQVWSQAQGLGFAAQFTANDRAPAGRDMTDPLGLHMCGWAKDNRRCSWNSQTGCKTASRMQENVEEAKLFYIMRSLPPVRWPLGAPHGGSVGPPSS